MNSFFSFIGPFYSPQKPMKASRNQRGTTMGNMMNIRNSMAALIAGASLAFLPALAFAGEALDRITSSGVIKVATSANWAPQSFMNDKNEMDGFDVEVAREIAKRLGVKVEFVTPAWELITAGKWQGRWDVSVGSMTPTSTRSKVLAFPAIYYYSPAAFAVHEKSALNDISALEGKRIGVCAGCTFQFYLEHDLKIDAAGTPPFEYAVQPGEVVTYQGVQAVFDDMRIGDGVRLDALLDALPSIQQAISSGYPIKVIGKPVFYEPMAVAIDLGDDEFSKKLAGIIAKMHADGTLSALSKKWYGGIDYTVAE
ncbi:transporter substrate-binding domain-containing protein [Brucella sp. NM4]|uniref:transporter substrate-binding domain-containing protein n=1 Tax=Brucella/Ochrobactrum group TaxID=2826938 RepID=UPI0024BD5B22|nr:transporter substrate-binding domain-containing protein [Brucella sp. NM4]WHS29874.1 transporter substrate-binding domain-containing protein [Brucella sp. NM4]WHT44639.1 transporter substrate-binding domain-containing protein [Ochrobactrum sp. SSR]